MKILTSTILRAACAGALVLMVASCASVAGASEWVEPVHNQSATFLWEHTGGKLSGTAVITYDFAGNVMIRLLKNVPKPLLETTSTRDGRFFARGPLAGGGWSGNADRVPLRFSLWKALAEAWRGAIDARDGPQEVHTQTYRAAVMKESGRVRELSVSSTDNGEVIRLVMTGVYPRTQLPEAAAKPEN